MGFVNRTLARWKEFQLNGTSCFDELLSFKELLLTSVSKQSDPTRNEDKSPQGPLPPYLSLFLLLSRARARYMFVFNNALLENTRAKLLFALSCLCDFIL